MKRRSLLSASVLASVAGCTSAFGTDDAGPGSVRVEVDATTGSDDLEVAAADRNGLVDHGERGELELEVTNATDDDLVFEAAPFPADLALTLEGETDGDASLSLERVEEPGSTVAPGETRGGVYEFEYDKETTARDEYGGTISSPYERDGETATLETELRLTLTGIVPD